MGTSGTAPSVLPPGPGHQRPTTRSQTLGLNRRQGVENRHVHNFCTNFYTSSVTERGSRAHNSAMHISVKLMLALAVLTLPACGSGDGGADGRVFSAEPGQEFFPAEMGQEYVVGFGETIRIGTLTLEFTTLAAESRCPLNASCTWEGNALILVTATHNGNIGVLALNTAYPLYPNSGTFEEYRIVLRHLAPYPPWYGQDAQTYEATLLVDRVAP